MKICYHFLVSSCFLTSINPDYFATQLFIASNTQELGIHMQGYKKSDSCLHLSEGQLCWKVPDSCLAIIAHQQMVRVVSAPRALYYPVGSPVSLHNTLSAALQDSKYRSYKPRKYDFPPATFNQSKQVTRPLHIRKKVRQPPLLDGGVEKPHCKKSSGKLF